MATRTQKVETLLESFQSLRRSLVFKDKGSMHREGITPSQWGALLFITEQGQSTVKAMAERLFITSSAATQLIDGLVKSGYVTREADSKDRRTVALALSKKGKNYVTMTKKAVIQKFLTAFKVLTDKELDQYCLLNKKIAQGFLSNKK